MGVRCAGRHYNRETLEVKYRGLSIADALDLTVDEADELFESIPRIRQKLTALRQVGLGYIQLGQPATTLSGVTTGNLGAGGSGATAGQNGKDGVAGAVEQFP